MSGGYSSAKSTIIGANKIQPARMKSSSGVKRKGKQMFSIKQRLRNWLMNDPYEEVCVSVDDDSDLSIRDHDNTINFNVVSASGGRIVQVRYYDRKTDRHSNKLHIVTPDENLAEALAHILTIESMSR